MHKLATPFLLAALAFAVLSFVPLDFLDVQSESGQRQSTEEGIVREVVPEKIAMATPVDIRPVVVHQPLPEAVRAIYMTSCVAGTPSFRTRLVELIRATEVNSVMIDIKDYSGTISFPPANQAWQSAWQAAECGARDMPELIQLLHDHDVFVIGRITVFQDPFYAPMHPELAVLRADQETVWRDGKGLSFIDVASTPYWDHIIDLSVDAYNIGFDELNYDYIRYPSDGNMADTYYPQSVAGEYGMDRQANLEAFFKYLHGELTKEERFAAVQHQNTGRASTTPYMSADLFGMTTTNFDDLSIGQVQDRAAPYFDFIAPMVYPSHYPNNFLGLGDPNDHPYQVVNHAMQAGVNRMLSSTTPMEGFLHTPITNTNASGTVTFTGLYNKPVYGPDKFRTWIQDFDYGGHYDAADVRAQIQASYDAGVNSWMIWAPSNIYTRAALLPAEEEMP
jgi:hypothetical protein